MAAQKHDPPVSHKRADTFSCKQAGCVKIGERKNGVPFRMPSKTRFQIPWFQGEILVPYWCLVERALFRFVEREANGNATVLSPSPLILTHTHINYTGGGWSKKSARIRPTPQSASSAQVVSGRLGLSAWHPPLSWGSFKLESLSGTRKKGLVYNGNKEASHFLGGPLGATCISLALKSRSQIHRSLSNRLGDSKATARVHSRATRQTFRFFVVPKTNWGLQPSTHFRMLKRNSE